MMCFNKDQITQGLGVFSLYDNVRYFTEVIRFGCACMVNTYSFLCVFPI